MTQMCRRQTVLQIPNTRAPFIPFIAELLIRSIVGKPAQSSHPVISASSGEHLVTYHWGSFPVYLHCLGGFWGGGADEKNFDMCWREEVQAFDSTPWLACLGQGLHLLESLVFVCKRRGQEQRSLGFLWEPSVIMFVKHLRVPDAWSDTEACYC
jgi:hypothetical protein